MPVQVVCPNPQCRKGLSIGSEFHGRKLRCPACRCVLSVSAEGRVSVAEAAPPEADRGSTIDSAAAKKDTVGTPPPTSAQSDAAVPQPVRKSSSCRVADIPPVIGPYEVRRLLGQGAFGVVYQGHDPKLKREVAIKLLNREKLNSAKVVERFLREAQVVAQMHHNHIVPVYELGEHDAQHYIASRFVPGQTLAAMIPEGGLDQKQAVGLVQQLLEALAYAHRKNVLHRDVKPANAIVDSEGQLYLMDFGLAVLVDESEGRATQDGTVLGTPSYMPPEQALGELQRIGPASDQYSAGIVLYELLTGRTPFEGAPTPTLLYHAIHTAPPRPGEFRPDIDPKLEALCLRSLAKTPEDRFPSCMDFAGALRDWRTGRDTPAPVVLTPIEVPTPVVPIIPPPATAPPTAPPRARSRFAPPPLPGDGHPMSHSDPGSGTSRRGFLLVGGLGLATLLGGGGYLVWRAVSARNRLRSPSSNPGGMLRGQEETKD
jgi:serine/threonine-protein kinase